MATFQSNTDLQLRTCPFNKSHKVKASGFQAHISKCEKQMAISLAKCPFNSSHRMRHDQYQRHVLDCPDSRQTISNSFMSVKAEKADHMAEDIVSYMKRDVDEWEEEYMSHEMIERETKNYSILSNSHKVTADWLFDQRFNESNGQTFVDNLHIQMMPREERKKYQQMCVDKIKELRGDQVQDQVQCDQTTVGQSSLNKRQRENEVVVQTQVAAVELRVPAIANPFQRLSTGMGSSLSIGIGRGRVRDPSDTSVSTLSTYTGSTYSLQ